MFHADVAVSKVDVDGQLRATEQELVRDVHVYVIARGITATGTEVGLSVAVRSLPMWMVACTRTFRSEGTRIRT